MATFVYQARNRSGKIHTGELVAPSKREAMLDLKSKGLQATRIDEQTGNKKKVGPGSQILTNKNIILFTEELSELLNAGLPLEPALASMEGREEEGALKETASKLRSYVTDGIPFHSALTQVSDKFDALYCNLVAAGEASGSLGSIISLHAAYLKEQAELRSRLLLAMLYPGFLVLACTGVILVFVFYLLPQIGGLLSSSNGQEIPIGVEVAMFFGDLIREKWMYIVGAIVLTLIAIKAYFIPEGNKARWDAIQINLPLYGKITRYGFYVQWLQTLSNLLSNGVPLVQALELTNETVQNRYYKKELLGVTEKVKDGIKLTSSMKQSGLFPSSMVDLVAVSDQTGKLDKAVRRAAVYYENQLGVVLKGLMGIITPVILFGMALLVGALCYTMLQAIYGSIDNMRK